MMDKLQALKRLRQSSIVVHGGPSNETSRLNKGPLRSYPTRLIKIEIIDRHHVKRGVRKLNRTLSICSTSKQTGLALLRPIVCLPRICMSICGSREARLFLVNGSACRLPGRSSCLGVIASAAPIYTMVCQALELTSVKITQRSAARAAHAAFSQVMSRAQTQPRSKKEYESLSRHSGPHACC